MLVLYLIIFAENFRFHFFMFLMQPEDGPGKKRVCRHSFNYFLNEHLLKVRLFFGQNSLRGQYIIQQWLLFTIPFSLYYRRLSLGIT